MSRDRDDFNVQPGRVRNQGAPAGQARSFVGKVMRAAKKAGHGSGKGDTLARRSSFGRGRSAAASVALRSPSRRVIIKTRVARHHGARLRSAPLATHISYLQRDGAGRSGDPGRLFDADAEGVDGRAFAARCEEDRHHFRFIVSPEDAIQMSDLEGFTRDLMSQAEQDLGTRLDWVAVPHHNTDNPHVHVLVRGRTDQGDDLVISRDYIGRGLRGRAEALAALELGPKSDHEIDAGLRREVTAERWTGLDRTLRTHADELGGVVDFRPGGPIEGDHRLRSHLIGRAQHLERLGMTQSIGPAQWTLRSDAEATLRALGERGDIIKTMHRALGREGREPSIGDFAIHDGDSPNVLGRLADRGLHDELTGAAYVVIEGTDGRAHHLRLPSLEATGDASVGAIVEARPFDGVDGVRRLTLLVRSDLTVAEQITAPGATWLDRQLVSRDNATLARSGFGGEVRDALEKRTDHLQSQGLARRRTQGAIFARDLLETLRSRELDAAAARISGETGLAHRPSVPGDQVTGVYRERVTTSSGRFAMIDNGLGFELVPWKPALDRKLGHQVSGVLAPGGGIDWSLGRKRGIGIG